MGDGRKKNANALKYGVMVKGVLTSRGEKCVYRDRCSEAARRACVTGRVCPEEETILRAIVASMRHTFAYAEPRLGTHRFEELVQRFGILSLRRSRLSRRIGDEAFLEGGASAIAVNRYATALHREVLTTLTELTDPESVRNWFERL